MKKPKEIVNRFNEDIDTLEYEVEDVLSKVEEGIRIAKNALAQLRGLTICKKFKNQEDEIFLFKHLKSKIYSR